MRAHTLSRLDASRNRWKVPTLIPQVLPPTLPTYQPSNGDGTSRENPRKPHLQISPAPPQGLFHAQWVRRGAMSPVSRYKRFGVTPVGRERARERASARRLGRDDCDRKGMRTYGTACVLPRAAP